MGEIERGNLELPTWIPDAAQNYICHTVLGLSIRALAKENQCHPSTILRQVRRFEAKRDDPLIDAALISFAQVKDARAVINQEKKMHIASESTVRVAPISPVVTNTNDDKETMNILRRLCEKNAVLAVAKGMETAVVVREDQQGNSLRTAIVSSEQSQQFAVRGWITCGDPDAKIMRYSITSAGRRALRELTAKAENMARGLIGENAEETPWETTPNRKRTLRYLVTESPLIGLSRRRDKDGQTFLSKEQVSVGERLRQDFELSDLGTEDEDACLAILDMNDPDLPVGVQAARERLRLALTELGPGLADISLQCCCMLKGLELTEKKMGWSSRSGKIVLRIALTRLIQHYAETQGRYEPMIG